MTWGKDRHGRTPTGTAGRGQEAVGIEDTELMPALTSLHFLALTEERVRDQIRDLVRRKFGSSGVPANQRRITAGLMAQQMMGCLREAYVMPADRARRMREWVGRTIGEALGVKERKVEDL